MTDKELLVEMLRFIFRNVNNVHCPVCYNAWKYHDDEDCLINHVGNTTNIDVRSLAYEIEYEDCD